MEGYHGMSTMTSVRNPSPTGQSMSAEPLIQQLNEDLSGELQAVIMYLQYAALVQGPYRPQLRELFLEEVDDELKHARLLADKIAALGGVPTTVPRPVPEAHDPIEMLQNILDAERRTIDDYTQRVLDADTYGDVGLRVEIEDLIAEETRHRDEISLILAGFHAGP